MALWLREHLQQYCRLPDLVTTGNYFLFCSMWAKFDVFERGNPLIYLSDSETSNYFTMARQYSIGVSNLYAEVYDYGLGYGEASWGSGIHRGWNHLAALLNADVGDVVTWVNGTRYEDTNNPDAYTIPGSSGSSVARVWLATESPGNPSACEGMQVRDVLIGTSTDVLAYTNSLVAELLKGVSPRMLRSDWQVYLPFDRNNGRALLNLGTAGGWATSYGKARPVMVGCPVIPLISRRPPVFVPVVPAVYEDNLTLSASSGVVLEGGLLYSDAIGLHSLAGDEASSIAVFSPGVTLTVDAQVPIAGPLTIAASASLEASCGQDYADPTTMPAAVTIRAQGAISDASGGSILVGRVMLASRSTIDNAGPLSLNTAVTLAGQCNLADLGRLKMPVELAITSNFATASAENLKMLAAATLGAVVQQRGDSHAVFAPHVAVGALVAIGNQAAVDLLAAATIAAKAGQFGHARMQFAPSVILEATADAADAGRLRMPTEASLAVRGDFSPAGLLTLPASITLAAMESVVDQASVAFAGLVTFAAKAGQQEAGPLAMPVDVALATAEGLSDANRATFSMDVSLDAAGILDAGQYFAWTGAIRLGAVEAIEDSAGYWLDARLLLSAGFDFADRTPRFDLGTTHMNDLGLGRPTLIEEQLGHSCFMQETLGQSTFTQESLAA